MLKIDASHNLIDSLEESMQVLDMCLEKLSQTQASYLIKFGFCLMFLLVLPRSVETTEFSKSFINMIYIIFHIMTILVSGYFFAMATVWNRIERYAITAVKSAISTRLKNKS